MSLDTYLKSRADRCSGCGYHVETQGCHCAGLAAKAEGIARADAGAEPEAREAIDRAIQELAATGEEWSANDLRSRVEGVSGPIMGARFNAAARSGLIRDTGKRIPSTLKSTHAHEVRVWIGAAA